MLLMLLYGREWVVEDDLCFVVDGWDDAVSSLGSRSRVVQQGLVAKKLPVQGMYAGEITIRRGHDVFRVVTVIGIAK